MFASLLMLFMIAAMLVPGLVMGNGKTALRPKVLLQIFVLQAGFFLALSVLCKAFPWLIDPRINLF